LGKQSASLTARRLKRRYLGATNNLTLGGSDVFGELAGIAAELVAETDGPHRVVAYVLYMFFRSAAYDFSDRPVSVLEASDFNAAYHQHVLAAIEYVLDEDPDPNRVAAIYDPIIGAHIAHIPLGAAHP